MYFTPTTLFSREVTVSEVASISYWTKTGDTHVVDPRDWFLNIYTKRYTEQVGTSFFGTRIGSEPYFSESLADPASTWNQWTTGGANNQLRFFESTYGYFGAYTDPHWPSFAAGASLPGSRGLGVPYATQPILFFSVQTATAWAAGFTGQLDGLRIELTDGSVGTVNFEPNAGTVTVTKVVDNTGGGTKAASAFPLFVDATSVTSGIGTTNTTGLHTVSETADLEYTGVISGDCALDGTITLAADDVKTCTITNTFKAVAHDVDAHLTTPIDIALGPSGIKISDIKADCKNEDPAEMVRCTIQVSGLPLGCTAQSGSGPLISSPGGFLLDNTSSYGINQTKKFDFTLTTRCSPNLAKGVVVNLKLKVCADGGFLNPTQPCSDLDITPDASPNVVEKVIKLHK